MTTATASTRTPVLQGEEVLSSSSALSEHDIQRDYAERSILAMFYPDEMNRYDIATTYASLHQRSIESNLLSSQLMLYTPIFHTFNRPELLWLQNQQKLTYQSLQIWKTKDKTKILHAGVILCLNIGTEPPDRKRTTFSTHEGNALIGYGREQGWIDPLQTGILPAKALNDIGNAVLSQYQRLQSKARYKLSLDPTIDDVKKVATSLRKAALKSETGPDRVLLHYNGHGVPRPTLAGEAWVFNPDYTQYIPLPIHDLVQWVGTPSLYIFDCDNAGRLLPFLIKSTTSTVNRAPPPSSSGSNTNTASSIPSTGTPPTSTPSVMALDTIVLGACGADESLPCIPGLPADIFTASLTTPIKLLLKWSLCSGRVGISLLKAFHYIIDMLPGKLTEKGTPLAELQKLLITITDTIAWSTFSRPLFHRLFRQDLFTSTLYRNYLVGERILASYNVHTFSYPSLPSTANHPLWLQFDNVLEHILMHLPALLGYSVADMQRMERLGLKPDIQNAINMNGGNEAWGIDAPETVPATVSSSTTGNPTNPNISNASSNTVPPNTTNLPISSHLSITTTVPSSVATASRSTVLPSPSGTTTIPLQWTSYFTTTNATNENDPLNLPIPQAASATASQRVLILRHRIRESRSTISTGTFTPYDNGIVGYRRTTTTTTTGAPGPSSNTMTNMSTSIVAALSSSGTNQNLLPSSIPPSIINNASIFANLIQNTNNYTIPSLDLRAVLGGSFFDDHLTSFATWMRTHSWIVRTKQARLIDCIVDEGTILHQLKSNDIDTSPHALGINILPHSSTSNPNVSATLTNKMTMSSNDTTGDPNHNNHSIHSQRYSLTNLSNETIILLSASPNKTSTINNEPVQAFVSVPRITAPLEIPILLQCILSKVHRQRAVQLLAQFVDLGPEAVNLLLINGFPVYLSKMFDITDDFPLLRGPLILLWAKILAIDTSTSTIEDIAMKSGAITVFCRCILDYIAYQRTVKVQELRNETIKHKKLQKLYQYAQNGLSASSSSQSGNRRNGPTDTIGTNIPKILRKTLSSKDGNKFPSSPRVDASSSSSTAMNDSVSSNGTKEQEGKGTPSGNSSTIPTAGNHSNTNNYDNNPWICVSALFCLTRIITVLPDTAIQHQSLLLTVIDTILSPLGIWGLPTHAVESSSFINGSPSSSGVGNDNNPFSSFVPLPKEFFTVPDNTIFSDHSLHQKDHELVYRGYLQQWGTLLLSQLFTCHKLFLTTVMNEGYIAINGPHAMNNANTSTNDQNTSLLSSRYHLLQHSKSSTFTSTDITNYSLKYNSLTVDRLLHHLGNSFIGVRLTTLQSLTKLLGYTSTIFTTMNTSSASLLSSSSATNPGSTPSPSLVTVPPIINSIPSTHIETLGIQLAQYADQYWRSACMMHITRKEMMILNENTVHPSSSLLLDTLEAVHIGLPVSTLLTVVAQDMGTCMVNTIDGVRCSKDINETDSKTEDIAFSQDMYLRGAWALAHSLIVSYGTCSLPYGLIHSTSNRLYQKEQEDGKTMEGNTGKVKTPKEENDISFLSVIQNAMKPSSLSTVTRNRVRFILKVFAEKAKVRMIKEEQLLRRQQLYYSKSYPLYSSSNTAGKNSSYLPSIQSGSGNNTLTNNNYPQNGLTTTVSSLTNNPSLVNSAGNNNDSYSLRKMNSSKSMLYMDMVPLPAPLPLSASIPLLNTNAAPTTGGSNSRTTLPATALSIMNAPSSVVPSFPLPPTKVVLDNSSLGSSVLSPIHINNSSGALFDLRNSPVPMLSPNAQAGGSPNNVLLPSIRIPNDATTVLPPVRSRSVDGTPPVPGDNGNHNGDEFTDPPPLDILEQALTKGASHKTLLSVQSQHDRRASSPSFRLLTSLSSPALHLLGIKANKEDRGTPKPNNISSPLSHTRRRSTRNSLEVSTPSSFHFQHTDTRSLPPVVLENQDRSNASENDLIVARENTNDSLRYNENRSVTDSVSLFRQSSSASSVVSFPGMNSPSIVPDQRGTMEDNQSKDSYSLPNAKRSTSLDNKKDTPSRRISGSGSSVDTSNNVAAVRYAQMKNARKQARATIIALRKAWSSLRLQTLQAGYIDMNTNSMGMITGSSSLLRETCLLPWIGCVLSDGASMVRKEAILTLGTVIRNNILHEAGFTTVASASLLDFMTGGDVLLYTLLGKVPKDSINNGRRSSGTSSTPFDKDLPNENVVGTSTSTIPLNSTPVSIGSSSNKSRTGPKSVEQSRYSLLRRVLSSGFTSGSSTTGGTKDGTNYRSNPNTPREEGSSPSVKTPIVSTVSSHHSSSGSSSGSVPNGGRNVRSFGLPSELITLQSLTSVMLYSGTVFEALTENYCNPGPTVRTGNSNASTPGTASTTSTAGTPMNNNNSTGQSSSSSSQLPPLSLGANTVTKTLTQSCTRALGARGLLYLSTWLALCRASNDPVPEIAITATDLLQYVWYRIVFTCVQSILKQLPVQESLNSSLSQSKLSTSSNVGGGGGDETNVYAVDTPTKPPPSLSLTTLRSSRIYAWKQACINLWKVSPMPPLDTNYSTSTVTMDAFTSMLVPLLPPLRYMGTNHASDGLTLTKLQTTTQHSLFLRTLVEGTHLAIAAYDDSAARDIVEASSRITAAFDAFRTGNRTLLYSLLLLNKYNLLYNNNSNSDQVTNSSRPYSNDGNSIIPVSMIRQMNASMFSTVALPMGTGSNGGMVLPFQLPPPLPPSSSSSLPIVVSDSPAFGAIGTVPHFKHLSDTNGSFKDNSTRFRNGNPRIGSSTGTTENTLGTKLNRNNTGPTVSSNSLMQTPAIGPLQIIQEGTVASNGRLTNSNNNNYNNNRTSNNLLVPLSLTTPALEPVTEGEAIGYDLGAENDLEILPPPILPQNRIPLKTTSSLLPLTGSTDMSLIQLEQQALNTSTGSLSGTSSMTGSKGGTSSSHVTNRLLTNVSNGIKNITPQASPLMKPIRPSYTAEGDRDVAMSKILQLEENGLLKRNLQLMEAESSLQNERLRAGSGTTALPHTTLSTNTSVTVNEGINTTMSLHQLSNSVVTKPSVVPRTLSQGSVLQQQRSNTKPLENKPLTKLTGPIPPSASSTNIFALHQKEKQQQYYLANQELSNTNSLLESSSSGLLNVTDESNRSYGSLTENGLPQGSDGTVPTMDTVGNGTNDNNRTNSSSSMNNQPTTIMATAGSFWQIPATVVTNNTAAVPSAVGSTSSVSSHIPIAYIPVVTEESIDQQLRSVASTTPRLTPSLIARVSSANVRNIRTSARKFGQKVIFDTKVPFTNNLLFHPTRDMIVSTDIAGTIGFWSTENGVPIQSFSNNVRDARTIANKDVYETINYAGTNQGTVNASSSMNLHSVSGNMTLNSTSALHTNLTNLRNRTMYGTHFWTPTLHQRIRYAINGIDGYSIPSQYRNASGVANTSGMEETLNTNPSSVSISSSASSSSSTLFRTGRVSGRITGTSNVAHRPPLSSQAYRRPVPENTLPSQTTDETSPILSLVPTENENLLQSMLNNLDEYNAHPSLSMHLQPINNVITSLSWIDEHSSCHLLTGSDDGIVRIWHGDDIVYPTMKLSSTINNNEKQSSLSSSSSGNTVRSLNGTVLPNDFFSSSSLVASSSPRLLLGIRVLPELSGSNSDFDKYDTESRLGIGRSGNTHSSTDYNNSNISSGTVSSSNTPNTMDTAALSALWLPGPGQLVAAGGRSSVVRIWDITTCRCTSMLHTPIESGPATCLTTAWPGTHILLAGTVNGDIHVLDTRIGGYHGGNTSKNSNIYGSTTSQYGYGSIVQTFREHTKFVVNVAQAKTGSCYAVTSGSLAADVRFWDLRAERSLAVVTAHRKGAMTSLAVHDYAPLVATGSIRRRVRILTNTGENVDQISNHESFGAESLGPVSAVAWHPSQLMLAIGAQDSIIALRKASAGM